MAGAEGPLHRPLFYMSAYFERHRVAHHDGLLNVCRTGECLPWVEFFLRGVRMPSGGPARGQGARFTWRSTSEKRGSERSGSQPGSALVWIKTSE